MKNHTKKAFKDFGWTVATCGLYFVIIFLRVLFTSKEGQEIVEEEIDKKIKAKLILSKQERNSDEK